MTVGSLPVGLNVSAVKETEHKVISTFLLLFHSLLYNKMNKITLALNKTTAYFADER